MSHYLVKKSSLKGVITIPSSKSHTLRAILFGAMGDGKTFIHQYLPSSDTQAMIAACRLLGVSINISPETLEIQGIKGCIGACEDVISAGNSGIVLRFLSALGSLGSLPIVVTGDHSIRHQRPMKALLNGLNQLGVFATSMRGDGYAPVIIQGPMQGGKVVIAGEDSQPISALLIASAFAKHPTEIYVKNPGEKPWIALTLDWFDRLGITYEHHDYSYYKIMGNSLYQGFTYTVPGDFSSSAFPLAAALITSSELTLKNIDMEDIQGDKELIGILQKMGANIEIDAQNKTLSVKKGPILTGISIDLNSCIDAITILAVIACFAKGTTHIYNAAIAKQKECNRITCITKELKKMGADITETEDGVIIKQSFLKGSDLYSYEDHRMAMSLTVAALGAVGESRISSVQCVSKTFPTFMSDFNLLGACIEVSS